MNSRFDSETLGAYVDGELSSYESAEIANRIAIDPDLAQQVATLSSLKAALGSASCGLEGSLQIDLELPVKERHRLSWVAAIAGVFVLGALIATLIMNSASLLPNQGLRLAEEVHKDWLEQKMQSGAPELQQSTFVNPDYLQIDAYVPDLSEVNLAFSGVRNISSASSKGIHVGYLGPKGCMVSLVVLDNTAGLSPELAYFERDGRLLYGWQVKQTGFYLLAYKMDPARLSEVARVVNRLTRERLPLDPESIIALKQARSSSKPCLA